MNLPRIPSHIDNQIKQILLDAALDLDHAQSNSSQSDTQNGESTQNLGKIILSFETRFVSMLVPLPYLESQMKNHSIDINNKLNKKDQLDFSLYRQFEFKSKPST